MKEIWLHTAFQAVWMDLKTCQTEQEVVFLFVIIINLPVIKHFKKEIRRLGGSIEMYEYFFLCVFFFLHSNAQLRIKKKKKKPTQNLYTAFAPYSFSLIQAK